MDARFFRARAAVLSCVISFVIATDAGAQSGVPFATYRTFETPHFIVTFEVGLEDHARRAATRAEAAHARLARAYGSTPRGKIRLVIVDQGDVFNGSATPSPTNRIVAFAHTPVEGDLFYADDNFRLRLEQTPGSVNGHHAKLGGLLLHVFEVTSIARNMAKTMNANSDLVIAGALLHDIGKVEAYEIEGGRFGQTPCGLLLGHVVLGCLMLERRLAAAGRAICSRGQVLDLQHMILSHHGSLEFGSPVQPMTAEAELVHWADEASAKANDMIESLEDSEAFTSGKAFSDKRPWRVGRRIWRRPDGIWQGYRPSPVPAARSSTYPALRAREASRSTVSRTPRRASPPVRR